MFSTSKHTEIQLEGLKWNSGLKKSHLSKQVFWTWQDVFATYVFVVISGLSSLIAALHKVIFFKVLILGENFGETF